MLKLIDHDMVKNKKALHPLVFNDKNYQQKYIIRGGER